MAKPNSKFHNGSEDFSPKFLDEKIFSKLFFKEKYNFSKQGEASYYGRGAGSVPFLWESQPGTPKHTFNDNPPPPLTPPPSYHFSRRPNSLEKNRSNFFHSIFPSKKLNGSPSSSSFSSLDSATSSPFNIRRNYKARSCQVVRFGNEEDENQIGTRSPTSTLCFGPRKSSRTQKSVKRLFCPLLELIR